MPGPPQGPTPEFLSAAAGLGVEFEPGDLDRLSRFLDLLYAANEKFNLTAIRDRADAWMKHIFDAMTLVPVLASIESESPRFIDIGSGGGVPGIPLAIVMPTAHFTLVEATGKKADFLRSTVLELALKNVTILNDRAERLGQDRGEREAGGAAREGAHRESYDAAIARALGHLAVVAELCGPLVRIGGCVLAVKGAKAERELTESSKALGLLGLRHLRTDATPTGRIVVLEKTTRTPRTYPRRDGEPARAPLGVPKAA